MKAKVNSIKDTHSCNNVDFFQKIIPSFRLKSFSEVMKLAFQWCREWERYDSAKIVNDWEKLTFPLSIWLWPFHLLSFITVCYFNETQPWKQNKFFCIFETNFFCQARLCSAFANNSNNAVPISLVSTFESFSIVARQIVVT